METHDFVLDILKESLEHVGVLPEALLALSLPRRHPVRKVTHPRQDFDQEPSGECGLYDTVHKSVDLDTEGV